MGLCACRMLEDLARRRSSTRGSSTSTEGTDEIDTCCPAVTAAPRRHVRMVVIGSLTMIWSSCMAVLAAIVLALPLSVPEDDHTDYLHQWGLPAWPFFAVSLQLHVIETIAGWMLINGALKRSSARVAVWIVSTFAMIVLYIAGAFISATHDDTPISIIGFSAFGIVIAPCYCDVLCFYFLVRRDEQRVRRAREVSRNVYSHLENDPDPEGARLERTAAFSDLEDDSAPPTPPSVRISRARVAAVDIPREIPPTYEETIRPITIPPALQSPHASRSATDSQTDSQTEFHTDSSSQEELKYSRETMDSETAGEQCQPLETLEQPLLELEDVPNPESSVPRASAKQEEREKSREQAEAKKQPEPLVRLSP